MNGDQSRPTSDIQGSPSQIDSSSAPPDYDTLSMAPPAIDDTSASNSGLQHDEAPQARKKSVKEKWQDLKREDEQRRADRVQHVTHAEADRITGLDKHRELEAKKSAERKRGGVSMLGAFFLS